MGIDVYRFGRFTYDPTREQLTRDGHEIEAQPLILRALAALLQRPGEVVDRATLLADVWDGTVVSDDAIHQAIRKLRVALDDEARPYRFVQTVPRRGYRFVADELGAGDEAPDHGPPLPRTPLVGRVEELARIQGALRGGARLLTVIGFGGIGKTRLALAIARDRARAQPGSVLWCELAALPVGASPSELLAAQLHLAHQAQDPTLAIARALAGWGPALLVLDNAEHVHDGARALVGAILDRAPELQILVTSRTSLGLRGEHLIDLGPLAPDDALALLHDRATAAGAPAPEPGPARALIERLDRLPLAIELAAARLRALPIERLTARLGERLDLLAAGTDHPERHRTIAATIAWSLDLLDDENRRALQQLAVFEDTFNDEAAEAVVELSSRWALDAVQDLVQASLVQRAPGGRLALLVTVRDHLRQHPIPAVDRGAQERHLAWFSGLGERRALLGRGAAVPDLLAATRYALATGRRGPALDALQALTACLDLQLRPAELVPLADQLEAIADLDPSERIRLDLMRVEFGILGDDLRLAAQAARRALAQAMTLGDRELLGRAHLAMARAIRQSSDWSEAQEHARTAAALFEEIGDTWHQIEALVWEGAPYGHQRDLDAEIRQSRHLLAMATAEGHLIAQGDAHDQLGVWLSIAGRFDEAAEHLSAAAALHRSLGASRACIRSLVNLGVSLIERGHPSRGIERYEQGLREATRIGATRHVALIATNLAAIRTDTGDPLAGERHALTAIDAAREAGSSQVESIAQSNLGAALYSQGRLDDAERVLAGAAELHGPTDLRAMISVYRVLIALDRGERERARALLDASLQNEGLAPAVIADLQAARALVLLRDDQLDDAEHALGIAHAQKPTGRVRAFVHAVEATLAARQGDPARVRTAVAAARAMGDFAATGTVPGGLVAQVEATLGD